MAKRRSGMGKRGVSALIGGKQKAENSLSDLRIDKIAIDQLVPGEYQPRQQFGAEALQELSDSIRIQGIVQPIVVKALGDDRYEIIAGERRWRAAKQAGLESVPVVIRKADNQATLAMALIENMQREDLNPIETALGLKRLMQEFDLTQQAVADAVGRSRASVTNLLRLLKLPQPVQNWLHDGKLSMGHARAIITLPETIQLELAEKAILKQWTVREIEQAVQNVLVPSQLKKSKKPALPKFAEDHQARLAEKMATDVKISHGAKGRGKIEIAYRSEEELKRLLHELNQ
ncbi:MULTISPECIES: ParB/RepB/Spo0J family partition protein [Piscirickettsiaceae]|jgi:ParB family chromosome partitioning protein|uniref:Probable chromosome-partitioning protein ParB n=1 Tax=Hydrogenovibrio thermophilus TaxID=265883 RepID=A0A410H5X1_9GAMM|nr:MULTISPECIES: ParB/RepB/Spo0J family partition protein [Piscirickettsiaceae]QAB16323.1 ParB/RepB/Spo0J family partition protein [Hydrogenovibrio thermophilus]